MNTASLRSLHIPMLIAAHRGGLRGLGEQVPVSVSIDTPYQVVGGKPKYTITGGYPGGKVYWTSFHDGKDTGEYNADYEQHLEPNGSAVLIGGAWTANDVGRWEKQILVQGVAGELFRAQVFFVVSDPNAAPPTGSGSSTGSGSGSSAGAGSGISDFLQQGFTIGGTTIPYWLPLAGLGAYLFLKKK